MSKVARQAQQVLARRELARRRLLEFTTYTLPHYQTGWVHQDVAARLERFAAAVAARKSPRLMLAMPPRIGKALEVDTPLLTTAGWKTIGTVEPGDYVFTEKGEPTRVVAVSPVFTHRQIFRVFDGCSLQSVYADAEHEWSVWDAFNQDTKVYTQTKVVTTADIYMGRARHKAHWNRYMLPTPEAIKFAFPTPPQYPCDAYTLGVYIALRTCMLLPERWAFVSSQFSQAFTLGELRTLPVNDLESIVCLSEQQRWHVVQGFVDASGYEVDVVGWCVAIPRSPLVARTIFPVLTSLGIPLRSFLRDVRYSDSPSVAALKHMEFILLFSSGISRHPVLSYRLHDKHPSRRGRASTNVRGVMNARFINGVLAVGVQDYVHQPRMRFYDEYLPEPASFEPLPPSRTAHVASITSRYGSTRCIQVENPTHLYLCGYGLMPTHNSELASTRFPAWFMGHHPDKSVIASSYSSDLPMGFSRKIRGMLRDEKYQVLFPDTRLSPDSQAVERWATTRDGEYSAVGVGGPLTGKGADVLLIDDPLKNMEEADNARLRDALLDWYQSTAYTRLAPGGGVLLINCLVGDTLVTRGDGTQTPICELRPGDDVVSYAEGRAVVSTVLNHQSNGHDDCFAVTTSSGIVVRGNARHPFLVLRGEQLLWIRIRSLQVGDLFVRHRGVDDLPALPPSPVCAGRASRIKRTINAIQTRPAWHEDTGGNTKARSAVWTDAPNLCLAKACVPATTPSSAGLTGTTGEPRTKSVLPTTSIATACRWMSTMLFSPLKEAYARFAANLLTRITPQWSTAFSGHCASTIATPLKQKDTCGSEPCCVTSAISPQATSAACTMQNGWLNTSEFILEPIVSIEPCGRHEVFDIQVAGTENFIANGLVSHNTRWHYDDLSGKLLRLSAADEGADQFEVVDYPAIAEQFEYIRLVDQQIIRYPEKLGDEEAGDLGMQLVRVPGDVLHPDRFTPEMVARIKRNVNKRIWSALYQQQPSPDEGLFFRADHIRTLAVLPALRSGRVIAAWDFAIGEKNHNDYTTCAVLIQDAADMLYVLDLRQFRRDSLGIIQAMIDVARMAQSYFKHMDFVCACEDGHIYRTLLPMLTRRQRTERVYFTLMPLVPTTDKMLRARPLQARMEAGSLLFIDTATAFAQAREELLQFPVGRHDDLVDALAWGARVALEYEPVRDAHTRRPEKSWRDKLKAHTPVSGSYMSA